METPLIQIDHITKQYSLGSGRSLKALDQVSLSVYSGETLGIVGESGSGKSTLARIIMGAELPDSGRVLYQGEPVSLHTRKERLHFAGKAQMIFQDSYASLNPRMTIRTSIAENLLLHGIRDKKVIGEEVDKILLQVGLSPETGDRFPHELSGGQRQRVGIARALILKPEFLILDEPVSSLDLSVQSQILNLLMKLKKELGLTYLFIAHDLNLVQYISDRIAVLYKGCVVETGESDALCSSPSHAYTKTLWESVQSVSRHVQEQGEK